MGGRWQPACLAGNLKSVRYGRALASALVGFSLEGSCFHFFVSSRFCRAPNRQLVSFFFKAYIVIE